MKISDAVQALTEEQAKRILQGIIDVLYPDGLNIERESNPDVDNEAPRSKSVAEIFIDADERNGLKRGCRVIVDVTWREDAHNRDLGEGSVRLITERGKVAFEHFAYTYVSLNNLQVEIGEVLEQRGYVLIEDESGFDGPNPKECVNTNSLLAICKYAGDRERIISEDEALKISKHFQGKLVGKAYVAAYMMNRSLGRHPRGDLEWRDLRQDGFCMDGGDEVPNDEDEQPRPGEYIPTDMDKE